MNLTALVLIGLIIYIILVILIIGFFHSATRKVRPKINEHEEQKQLNKDNEFQKGENASGNKKR